MHKRFKGNYPNAFLLHPPRLESDLAYTNNLFFLLDFAQISEDRGPVANANVLARSQQAMSMAEHAAIRAARLPLQFLSNHQPGTESGERL